MSAICMQAWFHCRGEGRPGALIGAGVARQQMSSQLGGVLPVEERMGERKGETGQRQGERKVEVENAGEREGVRESCEQCLRCSVCQVALKKKHH